MEVLVLLAVLVLFLVMVAAVATGGGMALSGLDDLNELHRHDDQQQRDGIRCAARRKITIGLALLVIGLAGLGAFILAAA